MDLKDVAVRHLAAWQDGDAEAVAARVASYSGPDTEGVLSGEALRAHAAVELARFTDRKYAVDQVIGDRHAVTLCWTLTAHHRGAYLGIPAVGRTVEVRGVDVVTEGGHVRRIYDRLELTRALGYGERFVPGSDKVREFGVSAKVVTDRTEPPGALALTWLEVRDDAESAEVDLLSVEVVKSLAAAKGFLGLATFDIGSRKFTVSAFDRPQSVRAVHARPHQRAMRRFFKGGLCTRVMTSIWVPAYIREQARCPECEEMVKVGVDATCSCGHAPPLVPLL